MTDKELKKLGRSELLQLLLDQMQENERLQALLDEAVAQLADRNIKCEKAGSIAQAAMEINGVFAAAQSAAQQYLDNIERLNSEQDAILARKREEAKLEADAIVAQAQAAKARALAEADAYWAQVNVKVQNLLKEQRDLQTLLGFGVK